DRTAQIELDRRRPRAQRPDDQTPAVEVRAEETERVVVLAARDRVERHPDDYSGLRIAECGVRIAWGLAGSQIPADGRDCGPGWRIAPSFALRATEGRALRAGWRIRGSQEGQAASRFPPEAARRLTADRTSPGARRPALR